jgi:hypothetical protein
LTSFSFVNDLKNKKGIIMKNKELEVENKNKEKN